MQEKTVYFKPEIHFSGYLNQFQNPKAVAEDLIFTQGRVISLNGPWHYAIDQYDTCLRAKWYEEKYTDEDGLTLPVDFSFDTWPEMELPCSYNLATPELFLYEGPMVFTRTFKTSELFGDTSSITGGDSRIFLRIGAANYVTYVFVNKKFVGMHEGASTPFNFDITPFLGIDDSYDDMNRILMVTDATRRREHLPTLNTDWFNYGGIFRDIELMAIPTNHIKDFRINLHPSDTYNDIRVRVKMEESRDCDISVIISELGINTKFRADNGELDEIIPSPAPISLWSPENPRLYEVTVRATTPGETAPDKLICDSVSDRVGFRTISVKDRDILLNGKPVFLKGVSIHEDSERTGRALTDEERIERIKAAKEMGCNFMRLAHYPHSERMAKAADELGILLWEEVPVYWDILFDNEDTYRDGLNQLTELVKRDFNRASVIIWSVGNENQDTDERYRFMSGLADAVHAMDDTRAVSAACLVDNERNMINDRLTDSLDIIGINEYYGWYEPDFGRLPQLFVNSNPDKPVIITEFGADAMYGLHGSVDEKGTEECQEFVYRTQVDVLGKIPYIKGMTPWIMIDFRCPRRTSGIQNYHNTKGLFNKDMKPKKAYYVLKDFYKGLKDSF